MSKAFVDTTILTDSLLKDGAVAKTPKKGLKQFEITELPVYAIKEFKSGPLKNFKWFHNKLAHWWDRPIKPFVHCTPCP